MDDKKRKRKSDKKISPGKKKTASYESNLNLTDLRQKYKNLKKEEAALDDEIRELESQGIDPDLQPLMKALHDYNEMKDITQVVLGYLADAEHCSVGELHVRYNLPTD